jgi:hypothetical protein
MGISNVDIGDLDIRVTCDPIEEVGTLGEDRSDVMVGVPGGRVSFVGEVPGEENFCATVDVACFEEDVMEVQGVPN